MVGIRNGLHVTKLDALFKDHVYWTDRARRLALDRPTDRPCRAPCDLERTEKVKTSPISPSLPALLRMEAGWNDGILGWMKEKIV